MDVLFECKDTAGPDYLGSAPLEFICNNEVPSDLFSSQMGKEVGFLFLYHVTHIHSNYEQYK